MKNNLHRGVLAMLALILISSPVWADDSSALSRIAPKLANSSLVSPAAADDMVMTALTLMGTPYKWGGTSPEEGFDCSGLVQYIYRDVSDVVLPRTAAAMAKMAGRDVTEKELMVGDLLFFRLGKSRAINHVGIYIGENRFVHAPRSGAVIRIDLLSDRYWMRYFDRARRLFTDDGHFIAR
jgi:cell wall-associated NlpC family hydrolase